MKANQAAFDVGQLADRMVHGYFAHLSAIVVARDPRSMELIPKDLTEHQVMVGYVGRKDGTQIVYHFEHFLKLGASDPVLAEEFARVWLTGALLTVGDALTQNSYFDHAPELELVRHLRNGVGHGNRFNITNPAILTTHPANNSLAHIMSDKKTIFEMTPALHGTQVLFDFMGPGDVLDLLLSVGVYLCRMGNGDPLRPHLLPPVATPATPSTGASP